MVNLLPGLLLVFSAAHLVTVLPPAASGLFGLLILLRIGWLEDNIAQDLLDRDRMPPGYVNTARRRQYLAWKLMARPPGSDPAENCPKLLATRMRAEVQGLCAVILSAAASGVAQSLPAGLFLSMAGAAVLLSLALRRADFMAVSLLHLEAGHPLERERLLSRTAWFNTGRSGPEG